MDPNISDVMREADNILKYHKSKKSSKIKKDDKKIMIGIGEYEIEKPDYIIIAEDGTFIDKEKRTSALICIPSKDFKDFVITDGRKILMQCEFTKKALFKTMDEIYSTIKDIMVNFLTKSLYPSIEVDESSKMVSISFHKFSEFKFGQIYENPLNAIFQIRQLYLIIFGSLCSVFYTLVEEKEFDVDAKDLIYLRVLIDKVAILDDSNSTVTDFINSIGGYGNEN